MREEGEDFEMVSDFDIRPEKVFTTVPPEPEFEMETDALYHYKRLDPEPISVINGWDLNFNAGNVVKYIARYRFKGDAVGDLEKAIMYLSFEIERLRNIGEGS